MYPEHKLCLRELRIVTKASRSSDVSQRGRDTASEFTRNLPGAVGATIRMQLKVQSAHALARRSAEKTRDSFDVGEVLGDHAFL